MSEATVPRSVGENIETIIRIEEEALRARSPGERLADTLAGYVATVTFFAAQIAFVAGWIIVNTVRFGFAPFDPYPFNLLGAAVSVEGVLIGLLVLIKQSRAGKLSERRNHLDLQVNLLTEKEVTTVIRMLNRIADRLGVDPHRGDDEARELAAETAVEDMVRDLHDKLPDE